MRLPELHLDFIRRRRPGGLWFTLGLLLLILGLALSLERVWRFTQVNAEVAAAEGRLVSLERKSRQLAKSKVLVVDPLLLAAPPALRQLNLPWDRLLLELELAGDDNIAILGIEPDPAKALVRINGEGKSVDQVLAYVERLSGTVSLKRPQLQVEEGRMVEGQKVVGFSILADWVLP